MAAVDLAPDFAAIARGDSAAAAAGTRLLWYLFNAESNLRSRVVRKASDKLAPKVLQYAPTAAVNNLDLAGCSVVEFTGSSSVNLTGILQPERDGELVFLFVTGSGTITLKHQNAGSDAVNRITTNSGGDLAVTTSNGTILIYLAGRWKQFKLV